MKSHFKTDIMGKRSVNIILCFVAGFLLSAYFGGKTFLLYIILCMIFLGIDLIYYHLLPDSLPCTLEIPGSCAKGRRITGYLHVTQDRRLPIFHGMARIHFKSLYYKQEQTIHLDIMLMGREEGIASFDIDVPYVGMLEITLEEAYIYGLLGICRKVILSSVKKHLLIMPDTRPILIDIPNLGNIDPEGEEIRESNYGYDPGTYQGIRPYREGDSLKHIHWKLTGKSGQLLVKELGMPSGREPRLYLDTRLPDLNPARIDQMIEDYFSFSMSLLDQGRVHIICWKSGGTMAEEYRVENLAMLEELMEPLFHISFWKDENAYDDTWIYFMSHDENSVYGFYHDEQGDYLSPVVAERRLWDHGRI